MSGSDFSDHKSKALQRLATLQRLREHAEAGNGPALLDSIEGMIEQESTSLQGGQEMGEETA